MRPKDRILRILYYETGSGYGGSSRALADLLARLDSAVFYPVVAVKNSGPILEKLPAREIIKLKNYYDPRAAATLFSIIYSVFNVFLESWRLCFFIKAKRISFVHVNVNLMSGIPAIIAAKISGIKCVCHMRQTRRLITRERFFVSWVDKFIVLSKSAYEIYRNDIPEQKLEVVPDGVDTGSFLNVPSGAFRREFRLDSAPLVGLAGRIVKGKGHKEFILAAKEVLRTKPELRAVIVGGEERGSERVYEELRKTVEREALRDKVIFIGWRSDIKEIMADLDILVQATTTFPEGFGLTIVEAMALSKPVIATDIPGPRDIVIDNITGFLVPPGDIAALADRMLYLLENAGLRRKMGEEGRQLIEEKFDIRNTVQRIEGIYKAVLKK